MKTRYLLPFVGILLFACSLPAQNHDFRCGTDEYIAFQKKRGTYPVDQAVQRGALPGTVREKRCDVVPEIPVVVHVFHLGEAVGTGNNISDAQIQGAITGLNNRWRNIIGSSVDMRVSFRLARRDPSGNATNGIVRVNASGVAGYPGNGVSFQGSPGVEDTVLQNLSRWPTDKYYNIWVVSNINAIGGIVSGYAYFPPVGGPYRFDGTIIARDAMNGTATSLTHEVGHAFGLFHTFEGDNGDTQCPPNADCSTDGDRICDTPPHRQSDCGAAFPCGGGGLWANSLLNYMSYCPNGLDRFTPNQKTRVTDAVDNTVRALLLESDGLIPPNTPRELAATRVAFPGPVMSDSLFRPVINFRNWGSVNITTIQYEILIDGNLKGSFSVNTSITPGQSLDVQLAQVGTTIGAHILQISVTGINGAGQDVFQYDNQICFDFHRYLAVANFCHDFEANTFPSVFTNASPGVFNIVPLAVNFTTCPTTQNRGLHLDATTSPDSVFSFMLGPFDLTGTVNPWLSFDLARAENYYCAFFADMKIDATINSGASYDNIYHKNDAPPLNCLGNVYPTTPERLTTAAALGDPNVVFRPTICADWRREVLDLTAYAGQSVTLRFTIVFNTPNNSTNQLGDNMYFDNFCLNNCGPGNALNILPFAEDTIEICTGVNVPLHMDIDQPLDHAGFLWQRSTVSPTGPFTHQGQSSDLNFLNLVPGTYYIRGVASRLGCFDSSVVTIIIAPDLAMGGNLDNATGCFGETATFHAAVVGGTSASFYQWQTSTMPTGPWTDIAGAMDTTYTASPLVGTTYYRLTAQDNSDGCVSVSTSPTSARFDEPVNIVAQPQDIMQCVGGNLQFSINATGGGTIDYQWQRANDPAGPFTNIGTNSNIHAPSAAVAGTVYFHVTMESTNGFCKDTSIVVTATTVPDPSIGTQPSNFTGCFNGTPITLNVGATGGVGLQYQWQTAPTVFDPWTNVAGNNAASYDVPTTTGSNVYRVIVSATGSGCGTVTSSTVTVNLEEPVSIVAEPQAIAQCIGGNQNLSINATGGGGFINYQWQQATSDTGPFTNVGFNNSSHTISSFMAGSAYYRVLLSSITGFCKDTSVTVFVNTAANQTITSQPANFTGCLGNPITVNVGATGGIAPLNYQWQSSNGPGGPWTSVPGANSATLTPPQTGGTTYYQAIVSSPGVGCNNVTSSPANITFDGSVVIAAEPQDIVQCVGGTEGVSVMGAGSGTINYQWQEANAPNGTFTNTGNNQPSYSLNTSVPGTQYFRVVVGSTNGVCKDTSVVVTSTVVADPSISTQPTNFGGCLGDPVTLSVDVTGGTALQIQWQRSNPGSGPTDIPGATDVTFTPPNTVGSVVYWANVFSNASGCGFLTSDPAVVTIDAPVSVSAEPQDVTQCVGGSEPVSLTVVGGGIINYQWQSSASPTGPFTNVGGNSSSFPVSTGSAGTTYFRALISSENGYCKDTSAVALSTVAPDPAITTHPVGQSGCLGTAVNLTVAGTGGVDPLGYLWQSAPSLGGPWTYISGVDAQTFTVPNTPGAAYYRAVIATNAVPGCNIAVSNPATVTLDASVGVATEPQSVTQCVGGTQPLSVTGTGTGTIVYQWQSAPTPGGTFGNTGTNQNTLALNTASTGTQYFRVIVSSPNALCRDTSVEVSATVLPDPSISAQPANVTGCVGDAISLNVNASGGIAPLSYQWQGSLTPGGPWVDVPGANTSTLNPPAVAGTAYTRVVISSTGAGCDAVTSTVATVTLDEKVSITADPQDISQCVGGTQSFSTTTAGAGASYQWQQSASVNGPFTNTTGATQTSLTPPAAAPGTTFFRLLLSSQNGNCRDTSLTVAATVVGDPQITVEPQGLEACVGGSATISSSFLGGITPTIQWQSSSSVGGPWTNVAGANAATYDPPLSVSGTTYYRMLVASSGAGCDNATSTAAQVLLHPKVDITAAPAPFSECVGGQDPLTVGATGGTSLTYQWQTFAGGVWQNIPGANGTSYTPPSLQNSALQYRIIVADVNANCGADTSAAVTVTVRTDFQVRTEVEVCNSPGGSNPTTVDFSSFVVTGDPNAAWAVMGAPEPPGPWSAKDFTGLNAGQTILFVATTTNAVAPCVNVRDTLAIKVIDCCPFVCTESPTQPLCNGGGATLNLNDLECAGVAPGSWFLTSGPGVSGSTPVPGDVFDPANLTAGTYTIAYQLAGTFPPVCASSSVEQVSVIRAPEAGTATAPTEVCENTVQLVLLQSMLTGADAGGSWTETSTVPTTPGAFNQFVGQLQTSTLAPGNYNFKYVVAGGIGCPDDETTVGVNINAVPYAQAGEDQTLTCDDPTVLVGDALNPSGGGFELLWQEISHNGVVTDPASPEITITEPGVYAVLVRNIATGCFSMDTVEVGSSQSYITDVQSEYFDPTCFGLKDGEIEILGITGGTAPFKYQLNGGAPSGNDRFRNLAPGTYTIRITDANDCYTERSFQLIEPAEIVLSLTGDTTIFCGDSLVLQASVNVDTNRIAGLEWYVNLLPTPIAVTDSAYSLLVKPQFSTTYKVVAYDDNGCEATALTKILVDEALPLYIPNVFDPTSTIGNHFFKIFGNDHVKIVRVFRVFDRGGDMIVEQKDKMLNDVDFGWDGTFNGKKCLPGVYVFMAKVEYCDGRTKLVEGTVTLIR